MNDYGDWEIKGTLTKIMVGEEGAEDNVDPLKDSTVVIPTLIPTMHVHGWYFGLFRLCLEDMIAELHG